MTIDSQFVHLEGEFIVVSIDLPLYSLTAIQKAAHAQTGRCAVHLEQPSESTVLARFRLREAEDQALIDATKIVAEDFLNQVLDFTLRETIAQETESTRNLILAHALSQTSFLQPELEDADPKLDNLNISQSDIPHPRPLARDN